LLRLRGAVAGAQGLPGYRLVHLRAHRAAPLLDRHVRKVGFYWLGRDPQLRDTMHFEFLGNPDRIVPE
jgi:hypothetical protein